MALESLVLAVGLLLLFAKLLGLLTERFGLSSLVGEILAGVLLGPVIGLVSINAFLDMFITFGIVLLLFLAGLEVKFEDLKSNVYVASAFAMGAGLLSFFLGVLVGVVLLGDLIVGIAIGTVLTSTSNGTLFALLMKTRHMKTPVGRLIIAATIADDIVGIMMLSIFSFVSANLQPSINDISSLFFVAIGLYLVVLTAGERIVRGLLALFSRFHDEHVLFSLAIALAFLFSYFTQNLKLSLAAGAFLAGMTMANSSLAPAAIEPKVRTLGYSFLIPLFYAAVGTLLVIVGINYLLIAAILLAALVGKFVGSAIVGKLGGFSSHDIKLIGISLMPRGNENIALAQLVFVLGIITTGVYTSIIFAMIGTIIVTPLLMRAFLK